MEKQRADVSVTIAVMSAFAAVICIVFLLRAAVSVADHVPYALDPNEGWNAYHADAAFSGRMLYKSPPSFIYNNYPPLSFYAVGLLGRALSDTIEAGRILSLICAVLTSFLIAWAARRIGCTWLEACWGAAIFLTILLMDYKYVGMNDPQLMGHAFAMAGLVLVLGEKPSLGHLLAVALLFSAAFFIKSNLFVLPLATVLWLLIYDRRSAIRLAMFGATLLFAGCGAFQLAYDKSLWSQINAPRSYDVKAALKGLEGWLELSAVPAMTVAALPLWIAGDRHIAFCLLYFVLSLMVGTILYGGAGVEGNVFFDALIALALCAAVGAGRFSVRGEKKSAQIFAACQFIPLVAGLAYLLTTDSIAPRYWLEPRAPARLLAARDIGFLRAQEGPVMCALLTLCYWAGKDAEMDVDLTGQALLTGQRDAHEVARLFASEKFAAIQLAIAPTPGFTENKAVNKAIAAHYRLDHIDLYGRFYIRRGATQIR